MNYESFHPIDTYAEKSNGSIFKRFFTKLNSPIPDKIDNETQKQKLKKTEISNSTENISKLKSDSAKSKPNLKQLYLSKRHSSDIVNDNMFITRILKSVKTNLQSTLLENSEIESPIDRIDKEYWMPDSICRKCYSCEEEFTTIKRKHHCRMCGQIFCYRCCTDELPGSLWNLSKPQRSCKLCFMSYYAQNGLKLEPLADSRIHKNSVINQRSNKSNISPRGSITSETFASDENNLAFQNKNLSFSSNDIQYFKDQNSEPVLKFPDVDDANSESNGDEDNSTNNNKRNLSEIEEVNFSSKPKSSERRKSLFPPNMLSKEKLFGSKFSVISASNSATFNGMGSDQDEFKRVLLSIWKLIISETEKSRRHYFTKIRIQSQMRMLEHRFSFPSEEEESFACTLPIVIKDTNSPKSCIAGQSLISWIIEYSKVNEVSRATAICQSYLEMQLIFPYFDSDDRKTFKSDGTIYVIRELTADFSPRVNCTSKFFDESGINGNIIPKKSFGNSVFYIDYDASNAKSSNPEEESQIKSPAYIRAAFGNNEDTFAESIFSKTTANLSNRSCRYLEKLLKQELHDYNLDISWCNILLPICKSVGEKILPLNNGKDTIYDIRNFIQIKKIPNSLKNDCRVVYSTSMSKSLDFPMKKEIKNPTVILIRSSIDYWRHKKLVSFDPLLLQEEEYLKNCVIKIKNLEPDIVVVEGSVSFFAKDLMEKSGLLLVSNVRKEQIERLSRMLGASIFDSVDSLGTNMQTSLGKCSSFSMQKYTLTNGKNKCLLFFKLWQEKHGCSLLLHGKSLSELVRVKYVTKFILIAFKNAFLELAFLKNFQIRSLPLSNTSNIYDSTNKTSDKQAYSDNSRTNDASSTFLNIIESRCIAMSVNVVYEPPKAVLRTIYNPEFQNKLLSLEIINLSWKEKLNDVMKRKQRHICAELYDVARMNTRKHPLMYEPQFHAFTNSFYTKNLNNKEQCILYSDFRKNGSRFYPVNEDTENMIISTVNFDSSDLACQLGFLTKTQEIKWRNHEKKNFESIYDSFNPRNYQRILMLYSIQTRLGICEKPRKISLNYYDSTDRTLGNFVSSLLNIVTTCPSKCDLPIFDHVYKFVSNSGCIQVSLHPLYPLHPLESESHNKSMKNISLNPDDLGIKLCSWCSRCDKLLTLQPMSDETYHLSLGRFFDILFNLNLTDVNLVPGQCNHSLQTDIHYYFTQNSQKVLEIKYIPVVTYEFQTPFLFINFNPNHRSLDNFKESFKKLSQELSEVCENKTKYNLEIKEKLYQLKAKSKEDNELWEYLKQDSNSHQYSQTINDIYNLMEKIYPNTTNEFDLELFAIEENNIKSEIIRLWTDIDNMVYKWEIKLAEAFEREEKNEKRLSKNENKNIKNSNDNLLVEQEFMSIKTIIPVIKLEPESSSCDVIDKNLFPSNVSSLSDPPGKIAFMFESCDDSENISNTLQNQDVPNQKANISRSSTEISFEYIDDTDFDIVKIGKNLPLKDSDLKLYGNNDRVSSTNTMQPIKKFFTGFFNSFSYKILADPIPQNISYSFSKVDTVKVPVPVTDEFISSVVAFSLSCDVYLEMLSEYSKLLETFESKKSEPVPRQSGYQNLRPSQEPITVDSFNLSVGSPILNRDKPKVIKLDPTNKDRDISVRYYHRSEQNDLSDSNDPDNNSVYETKSESDDIKIDISSEDNLIEECNSKGAALNKPINKTTLGPDFVINLNNNKVKCVCRIFYAKQFHDLRQLIFQNDDVDFIRSLTECKNWATTGGKSGLQFRKTFDDRFIIKQLQLIELDGFKKFHQKYFDYITDRIRNKQKCVLAKILGVYQVEYNNTLTKVNNKIEFLVMENVFYNQKPSKIFDLKGNKQGATNISAEKANVSDNYVKHDKDFIKYSRENPLYVSWQAQMALKETLTRDTDFLQSLPVMDYSLLLGIDETNQVLVIGIIDYLRMFTMNKLIEMHIKQKLLTPHGELPTVIQPQKYQKRFLEAMEEYFQICPIPWDYLLLYPSNSNTNCNSNKNPSFLFNFSSIFPNKPPKPLPLKRSFERYSDENKLRLGLTSSI